MLKRVAPSVPVALTLAALPAAGASAVGGGRPAGPAAARTPFTMAVYGDAPYGTVQGDNAELDATPAFIDSINADPDVELVLHVGDIHSGKQFCTQAYDQSIFGLWTAFKDPLVYTPGDNEWTDCNKAGEGAAPTTRRPDRSTTCSTRAGNPVDYANGDPIANLDLIRSIFFAKPGVTLGSGTLKVLSQARAYDRQHPADAQYVENVMWQQHGVSS